jgi:hypothetical protein
MPRAEVSIKSALLPLIPRPLCPPIAPRYIQLGRKLGRDFRGSEPPCDAHHVRRSFAPSRNRRGRRMAKIAVTFQGTKDRLHQAYRAAKAADRLSGALYDRWMAEALTLAKGQPVERAPPPCCIGRPSCWRSPPSGKAGRTASPGCRTAHRGLLPMPYSVRLRLPQARAAFSGWG